MSITINKLNVSFEDKIVLHDLSLNLPESGFITIYGPSGCGKTTLLNCLAGIQKADSGTITGTDNKRIAMVFQENRLLPWLSALMNVAFGVDGDLDVAAQALAQVELSQAADLRPAELSGGMQRRVAIARALAFGGDILLLDEPDAGLDEELAQRVIARLATVYQGKLIILVTHNSGLAQVFTTRKYCFDTGGKGTQVKICE